MATSASGQSTDGSDLNTIEGMSRYLLERSSSPTREGALPETYLRGRVFGQWYVVKQNDDMDPTPIISMIAVAENIKRDGTPIGRYNYFGFQFFGPNLVSLETSVPGKSYWPECDFDLASMSVDAAKAVYISRVRHGGTCANIDLSGAAVSQMKAGSQARVRLLNRDLIVPLEGFTAALKYAQDLSRQ